MDKLTLRTQMHVFHITMYIECIDLVGPKTVFVIYKRQMLQSRSHSHVSNQTYWFERSVTQIKSILVGHFVK